MEQPHHSGAPFGLLLLQFFLAGWGTVVLHSHPLPDLPVRAHFSEGGALEVRVEVDPRAFADDPEALEFLLPRDVDAMDEARVAELQRTAERFVEERLRFLFDPVGAVTPVFRWEWRKLGDTAPLEQEEDTAVLVGSWNTTIAGGLSAYRLEARELGPGKMGIPLNVQFLNFLDGVQTERYAVLFPGETSYAFDLTGFSAEGLSAPSTASGMKAVPGMPNVLIWVVTAIVILAILAGVWWGRKGSGT